MIDRNIFIIFILIIVIISLGAAIIFRKPAVLPTPIYNEKPARDSINLLIKQAASYQLQIDSANKFHVGIIKEKVIIKTIYETQIKLVNSFDCKQLDSTICSICGIKR